SPRRFISINRWVVTFRLSSDVIATDITNLFFVSRRKDSEEYKISGAANEIYCVSGQRKTKRAL
ncbi:MAG: hypothetical protein LBR49_03725, partial [Tannerella sp.]|nr:hypothetical protein [Tannerella sp.]